MDDQGLRSTAQRRFWVNTTIGFLRVDPARLVLRAKGGNAAIRWTQARAARVRVTVETPEGIVLRTVSAGRFEPGTPVATWNGRLANGKLASSGRYVVRVMATNDLGSVELDGGLVVRRIARPGR
jgi:flagellar hook assembly protein FlgD